MQRNLSTGFVPTDRIIEVINQSLGIEWPWVFQSGLGVGENDDVEPSPLESLCIYWDGSDLRTVLGRNDFIEFDLADRILCALNLVELWRGPLEDIYLEVNLSPVEESEVHPHDPDAKKCARGECNNHFIVRRGRGKPRKYCSDRCKQMDRVKKAPIGTRRCAAVGCTNEFTPNLQWRGGQTQKYCSQACGARDRRKSSGRYGTKYGQCPNGHDRSEENTGIKNGRQYCRACARERERERYENDPEYRAQKIQRERARRAERTAA